jgi:hypothetical protein
MPAAAGKQDRLEPRTEAFYRRAMETLRDARVPFLVGGAYAFAVYTGMARHTKDLDLFVRRADVERALGALAAAGYRTELTFTHWLGKAFSGEDLIDVIFNSSNGVAPVDDGWFAHAGEATVLGVPVALVPAEEMIWQKALIMERERYDGADVAHLLRSRGAGLDWARLVGRFGRNWRVLLSHLILFGFIYPSERARVPDGVMRDLLGRLQRELGEPPPSERVCQGTLLSLHEYLEDVGRHGYEDARLARGYVSEEALARWTAAFTEE